MDFGKSFKFYRQQAGLTQKEAAKLIGVNDYQLGNYETNRSQPSLEILKKMSKAYSVSIDKMLGNSVIHNKSDKERQNKEEYIDSAEVLRVVEKFVAQMDMKKDE